MDVHTAGCMDGTSGTNTCVRIVGGEGVKFGCTHCWLHGWDVRYEYMCAQCGTGGKIVMYTMAAAWMGRQVQIPVCLM